jgi:hypothetical protein
MVDSSAQLSPRAARQLWGAVFGVKAGVLGAFAIILMMSALLLAQGYRWWAFPNVLATAFYGRRALGSGPGWITLSGIAIQVFSCGVGGILFGSIFAGLPRGFRRRLLGLIWGLAWYYFTAWFYERFEWLIAFSLPAIPLMAAYAVFGLILGSANTREHVSETVTSIS